MTISIKGSIPSAGLIAYHQEVDGEHGFMVGVATSPAVWISTEEAERLAAYLAPATEKVGG